MLLRTAIKLRLTELLEERQISQIELSKLCGISRMTIHNILKEKENVTCQTLLCLCNALKLTLVDFFSSPLFQNSLQM